MARSVLQDTVFVTYVHIAVMRNYYYGFVKLIISALKIYIFSAFRLV